jgi:hypothetical protein
MWVYPGTDHTEETLLTGEDCVLGTECGGVEATPKKKNAEPRWPRVKLHRAPLLQRDVSVRSENQMIENIDSEGLACFDQLFRKC